MKTTQAYLTLLQEFIDKYEAEKNDCNTTEEWNELRAIIRTLRVQRFQFKEVFSVPLDRDDLYFIVLHNRRFNTMTQFNVACAKIDAGSCASLKELSEIYNTPLLS